MTTEEQARRQVETELRRHSRRPVRQQLEALVRRVEALERREQNNMNEPLTQAELETNEKTRAHIRDVQKALLALTEEIGRRGVVHDQSKLMRPEVEAFTEFTPKLAGCTYGSDEYKGYLEQMRPALEHHYFNNRHHPEYWCFDGVTYYPGHLETGMAVSHMNLIDVLEMFCDWFAACKRHDDGDIRKSIEINAKRFGLSPQLASILNNTVRLLGNDS